MNSGKVLSVPKNKKGRKGLVQRSKCDARSQFKLIRRDAKSIFFWIVNIERNEVVVPQKIWMKPNLKKYVLITQKMSKVKTHKFWTFTKVSRKRDNPNFVFKNLELGLYLDVFENKRHENARFVLSKVNKSNLAQHFAIYKVGECKDWCQNMKGNGSEDSNIDYDDDISVVSIPDERPCAQGKDSKCSESSSSSSSSSSDSKSSSSSDTHGDSNIGDASEDSEGSNVSEDSEQEKQRKPKCRGKARCRKMRTCIKAGKKWWKGQCLTERVAKWRRRCWRDKKCRDKMICWMNKKCQWRIKCMKNSNCWKRVMCWRKGYYWWRNYCYCKAKCMRLGNCWTTHSSENPFGF